jgi:DNA-binding NtrC family response regulator
MRPPVAIVTISDTTFRERVGRTLKSLRWHVLEAAGGAEALAQLETGAPTTVILDTWLPDLEIAEFVREVESNFPEVDMISTDGSFERTTKPRSARRGELFYALRVSREWDGAAFNTPEHVSAGKCAAPRHQGNSSRDTHMREEPPSQQPHPDLPAEHNSIDGTRPQDVVETLITKTGTTAVLSAPAASLVAGRVEGLAEFYGTHPRLLEVCRRIRLVAPRSTPVLVQGPTGSGKELVARSLHRLSPRSVRPMVTLNCAAIPESLLEAELFGHAKGAFTGAAQGRSGRIEGAHGGTLFLDEIGEMPLPLQAKLLRFLEAGELQKVGDNEIVKVDVRVIAASHQPLSQLASQGLFRTDLYFRLAVFLIETPALQAHREDIPGLARLFLRRLTEHSPAKVLSEEAIEILNRHDWPGNVRELAHVIERAYILAEERREITPAEIEFASMP